MRGRTRTRALRAATAAVALAATALLGGPGAVAAVRNPGAGLSTNYDFARLVLRDGGWPVSANNVTVLTQWLRSEEPPTDWWDRDNPLNNGLGSGGGEGLGSYGSVISAAYYVAANLEKPAWGYPEISRDLRASAPVIATDRAIWRSSWASGHYGRGADWGTSPVPSVAAPAAAWQSPTRCPIAYPAGEVGPCGHDFSTTGTTWRSGSPGGVRGQELWAFSTGVPGDDTATWAPALAPGTYAVAAFLPTNFDDANVSYVVTDATGGHRVLVDQEPYANAWAPLGSFTAAGASSIQVRLSTASRGPSGATYVAADAVRFVRTAAGAPSGGRIDHVVDAQVRPPGPPQDVSALAGDGRAVVSWLAPSKDGGDPIGHFTVTSQPGGRTCGSVVRAPGEHTCVVTGLTNGTPYTFTVRAVNGAGVGVASGPSNPSRPLGIARLRLVAVAHALRYGERVVYRALTTPATTGGTVLFAEDGKVLRGCQSSLVVRGRASCALRLTATSRHEIQATFSGNETLTGAERTLALVVQRAPSAFRSAALPATVAVGATMTLRVWHLPGLASGTVDFSSGTTMLCTAVVRSGGGTCSVVVHLAAGVDRIVARYVGDRDFRSSLARTTVDVTASTPAPPSEGRPLSAA